MSRAWLSRSHRVRAAVFCAVLSFGAGCAGTAETGEIVELADEPTAIAQPSAPSSQDVSSEAGSPLAVPAAAGATTGGALALPAVDVIDLGTGESFDLSTYSPPGPTLVWFWAPH